MSTKKKLVYKPFTFVPSVDLSFKTTQLIGKQEVEGRKITENFLSLLKLMGNIYISNISQHSECKYFCRKENYLFFTFKIFQNDGVLWTSSSIFLILTMKKYHLQDQPEEFITYCATLSRQIIGLNRKGPPCEKE